MSVEMITMVVGFATILLAFAGGCFWTVRHMDARFDRFERNIGSRIDRFERNIGSRIDRVGRNIGSRFDRVETRIEKVTDELVEVKVAIARIEGPPRHLVSTR